MTQTITRQADIRYRVAIKAHPGIVVWLVRSSADQETYEITLVDSKVNNCTCKSRRPCYHMRDVQAREDHWQAVKADERRAREDEQEKFCDRCHKPATEYREQSGERLCEKCIGELERNAGATRTREVLTLNGNRPLVRERGIPMR